jgi:hypothetical protein
MSNISGDENYLYGASLRESHKISLKDHAHDIDYHQLVATPREYSMYDIMS